MTPGTRLLLFSDIHADAAAIRGIVERSPEVELVIGAGDFCNARRGLRPVVERLSAIHGPTVLVPGNAESADELADACSGWGEATVLHGEAATVAGVEVFGIGGGIPVTPFGPWSWDFTEEEARTLLAGCPEGAVLVSHSPPAGVVDVDSAGRHLGSRAVHEAVERTRPRLVVCGHIHGSAGQRGEIGSIPVINAGPEGVVHELS